MSTAETVKAQLNALLNQANDTTGKTDANLTAAIASLAAGFGQGGSGGGSASGIYMAKVTPSEDLSSMAIAHNLGTTDILLVALWAETLGDIVPATTASLAKFWAKTDIATQRGGGGFSPGYRWDTTNQYAVAAAPNSAVYETLTVTDENNISLPMCASGSTKYLAGTTYTVIVIAANAEV